MGRLVCFPVALLALGLVCLGGCLAAGEIHPPHSGDEVRVSRVIDGDTIEVEGGWRVRYIGIDTPEVYPQIERYGAEAAARNRDLVEGKVVRLESDQTDRDRYDRLLRYVYVDGLFVNAELVRLGYAHAVAYPPDTKYQEILARAEEEAQGAGRGLWGQSTCLPGPARALCSGGSGRSASTCQADASLPERQYGLHAGLHRSYA